MELQAVKESVAMSAVCEHLEAFDEATYVKMSIWKTRILEELQRSVRDQTPARAKHLSTALQAGCVRNVDSERHLIRTVVSATVQPIDGHQGGTCDIPIGGRYASMTRRNFW